MRAIIISCIVAMAFFALAAFALWWRSSPSRGGAEQNPGERAPPVTTTPDTMATEKQASADDLASVQIVKAIRDHQIDRMRHAKANGAIAATWRYRSWGGPPCHAAKDGKLYVIRGNWALRQKLINKSAPFLNERFVPPTSAHCHCHLVFLFHLRDIPQSLVTEMGKISLARARDLLNEEGI